MVDNNYDPNEQVVILRQHMQEILSAITWGHGYFSAQDLQDAYKDGRQGAKPSKITINFARARGHLEGYMGYDELPEG
jgi:hypothetical protein